ncbi:hypothetical protein M422DRAFT_32688 [Sphaerobolus stellatus SS14]|uniref:Uncharacterized protein n=1 Tax=Sphaerobolus stellatus (strain SS14) TaxID=990650 RepID=A0A0C9U8S7_SPHS4|nr:hypothetical protein M422DRAFT_32688 [Sphaerobolus stellatus SS14]
MVASLSLGLQPQTFVDTLVRHILQTCPELRTTFLAEMGKMIHASAVRVEFSMLTVPDEARLFLDSSIFLPARLHRISALLANPARYATAVKRLEVTDAGLPPPHSRGDEMLGLVKVDSDDDDSDSDGILQRERVALMPTPAQLLTDILAGCSNLESFVWGSTNMPPDGICEALSASCPRLSEFKLWPEPLLLTEATPPVASGPSPKSRSLAPKWEGPSLPLLAGLPLTRLHIARLSLQGSRALIHLFTQLGEESLLEEVGLDFVWLDDKLCQKLVEAGRKLRRINIGTCGTKLTDVGLVAIFEGCDSLEEFGLVEAQGRLTRKLWSKVENIPPQLHKFKIAMSEAGPHHSWTADHLVSLSTFQMQQFTHLSIIRLLPPLRVSATDHSLEYDPHIEEVANMVSISRDIVGAIRNAKGLKVLECDWWAWKPDDLKPLLEKCTQLEYMKIAFDAPFSKLLTLTAAFTPLIHLLKLSVCIPRHHSRGQIPIISASDPESTILHPLTPAASPVRHRATLQSAATDFAAQVFCADESQLDEGPDPSFPLMRDVKRFVKKCHRLVELEWYGRHARGTWLVTRSITTSKINTNVTVEYVPPVASAEARARAKLEKAVQEAALFGRSLAYNVSRQGSEWTGAKCEQLKSEREMDKESKEDAMGPERPGRGKRSGTMTSERKSSSSVSPVIPYTPISPSASIDPFLELGNQDHSPPVAPTRPLSKCPPSYPSTRNTVPGNTRTRSATMPGTDQSASGSGRSKGGNQGGNNTLRGRGGKGSSSNTTGGRKRNVNGTGGPSRPGNGNATGHASGQTNGTGSSRTGGQGPAPAGAQASRGGRQRSASTRAGL